LSCKISIAKYNAVTLRVFSSRAVEQIIAGERETACILTISSFSTNKDAC
jgi:hypothetical protein